MPTIEEICLEFGWQSKHAAFKKMQLLVDFDVIRKYKGKYTLNPYRFKITIEDLVKEQEKVEAEEQEKWRKKRESYNK